MNGYLLRSNPGGLAQLTQVTSQHAPPLMADASNPLALKHARQCSRTRKVRSAAAVMNGAKVHGLARGAEPFTRRADAASKLLALDGAARWHETGLEGLHEA